MSSHDAPSGVALPGNDGLTPPPPHSGEGGTSETLRIGRGIALGAARSVLRDHHGTKAAHAIAAAVMDEIWPIVCRSFAEVLRDSVEHLYAIPHAKSRGVDAVRVGDLEQRITELESQEPTFRVEAGTLNTAPDMRPETNTDQLADMITNLNRYIVERATVIAGPWIAEAREAAMRDLAAMAEAHVAEMQRKDDLIAELRRIIAIRDRQLDRLPTKKDRHV